MREENNYRIPSKKRAINNKYPLDTEKRLIELYGDVQYLLEVFGSLIVLRQSSSLTTLSKSEISDEAKDFVKRNYDTIYALLRT